jgi:hypothetical protein
MTPESVLNRGNSYEKMDKNDVPVPDLSFKQLHGKKLSSSWGSTSVSCGSIKAQVGTELSFAVSVSVLLVCLQSLGLVF